MSKIITFALALFGALCALVAGATPASAHAALVSTTPANGQVVAAAPVRVTLTFSEPVDVGLAAVRVFGPAGTQLAAGTATHPEGRGDTVAVSLPGGLATGTYTAAWRVLSADSHPVQGAFTFSVGQPSRSVAGDVTGTAPGDRVVGTLYQVARWTAFAGLALLVGVGYFVAGCWPAGSAQRAVRRLWWGGWAGLVGASVLALLVYGPYATGRSLAAVADPAVLRGTLGTRLGLALAARAVVLAVIALLPRWRVTTVLGGAVALATTWSIAGHGGAGSQVLLALPVDIVHLTAMSVWVGGLVVLGAVLLRTRDVPAIRAAVPRFSGTALVCVGLLVATGTYLSWRQVGTPAALVGTSYGWLLLGKLGLVAVLLALGAGARSWVRRQVLAPAASKAVSKTAQRRARRGPGAAEVARLRRLVTVEAGLALAVLALTSVLVNTVPARTARATVPAAGPASAPGPLTATLPYDAGGPAGAGTVSLEVFPGLVGTNEIHLAVADRNGFPRSTRELRATLSLPERSIGPLPVRLESLGLGHYAAVGATTPMPGRWRLAVTVRTSELNQTTVTAPLDIR